MTIAKVRFVLRILAASCLVFGLLSVVDTGPAGAAQARIFRFSASASAAISKGGTQHDFSTYGRWRAVFEVDDPNCPRAADAYFYAGVFNHNGPEGDASNGPHVTQIVKTGRSAGYHDLVAQTSCDWHVTVTNARNGLVRPLAILSKTGRGVKTYHFISSGCWTATVTNLGKYSLGAGVHGSLESGSGTFLRNVRPHHSRKFHGCKFDYWDIGTGIGHWRMKVQLTSAGPPQ